MATAHSQNERILAHLQRGHTITPLEAVEHFGCLRLAARIAELEDAGHRIEHEMVRDRQSGKRYARYRLMSRPRQLAMWATAL